MKFMYSDYYILIMNEMQNAVLFLLIEIKLLLEMLNTLYVHISLSLNIVASINVLCSFLVILFIIF